MMKRTLLGFLLSLFFVSVPAWAGALEDAKPLANQQFAQGLDDLGRELREWFGRWGDYFGSGTMKSEERPLIAFILRNREKLDLSAAQVKSLEQLKNDFQKESIRERCRPSRCRDGSEWPSRGRQSRYGEGRRKSTGDRALALRSPDCAHSNHSEGKRGAYRRSAQKVAGTAGGTADRRFPAQVGLLG